ncbi:beta strand repeat-containing protein [Acidithiobacillus thiooxidans]|uniref:beta strand repeat-containing protein n=1 Tax=Acidithiobacillus thiooxidans TaxID=930 RepID=UPI001111E223|nr:hypothetical protein [Acidithiobacillus thiooxidans]
MKVRQAASSVTVDGATKTNAGTVTVAPGTIGTGTAGFLLVAGAGTVNVGASAAAGSNLILAGTGFTANSTGITATGSAIQTASVLNLSGSLAPTSLAAAGNVNVAAGSNVTLGTATTTIGGAFSNSGNVSAAALTAGSILNAGTVTAGALTATGTAGIVNNGIINAGGALNLTATNAAGAVITNTGVLKNITGVLSFDASGTATNNGTIDFNNHPAANIINIQGANVTFNGTVNQVSTGTTPSALSSTNSLFNVSMATPSTSAGVVNLGSSLFYSGTADVTGAAVRVVSGGLVGSAGSALNVSLGSGKVGSYGYNLSLFPGTTLAAGKVNVTGTSGSNINLDGVLGNSNATAINVTGGNINASSNGGFAVSSAGATLGLTFYGNLNNPNGSAVAGKPASDFQYNYVPVNVASSGTVSVNLTPESTTTTAQNVNMLVNGSVTLNPDTALTAATAPLSQGGSTSVQGSYINNHLVVQATKNITVSGYWPGLVYLGTINAGTPGSLSSAGTITLNGALNNVLPANVSGSGGVFFMTSNPLGGLSATNTVTTNTNSWINFPAGGAGLANYYAATNPTSKYFYGAVINSSTPGVIGTQVLPSGDIQGR